MKINKNTLIIIIITWWIHLFYRLCFVCLQGSVEYADLNGEQPETGQYHPESNNYPDLPVPVD